jgi:hypothetical protein
MSTDKKYPYPLDGIETNLTTRWEKGADHHPKSEELYRAIEWLDWEFGGDGLCLKSGGDGDNGEHLMFLLDIWFESQEK